MSPFLIGLLVVAGLAVLAIVFARLRRGSRRRRLFAKPLSSEQLQLLTQNVPLYEKLPSKLQADLCGHMQVFLDEKEFFGCDGLEITEEIRITIAAFACMLLLNREPDYYPAFHSIFVYPGRYFAERDDADGADATMRERDGRFGEAWERGPVVLAWDAVMHGARDTRDGHNVVLHEFAHKLDEADGAIDGMPAINCGERYTAWGRVMSEQYEQFLDELQAGRKTVIDEYGGTEPAEFFAVLTETFFEKPEQLKKKHPELYEQLSDFYKLDPASWS